MATITSAQSGNWSDTATWTGGVVPTSIDDVVIATTHVIEADVDIDVNSISRSGSNNGYIRVSTARNIDVAGDINDSSLSGVSSGNSQGMIRIQDTNITDLIVVNANQIFANNNTRGLCVFSVAATVTMIVNADLTYRTGFSGSSGPVGCAAIEIVAGAIITVNGNIFETNFGVIANNSFAHSGIWLRSGNSQVTINGTITASIQTKSSQNIGVRVTSGTATINGIAIAQFRAAIESTGTVIFNGVAIASNDSIAINSNFLKIGGVFTDTVTRSAISANTKLTVDSSQGIEWLTFDENDNLRPLYTASLLTGYPLEADVEDGVTYGPVGEFTGTLDPVVIDTAQLASNLLNEMNSSNLTIAQGLRDGMGASAAAIAAVGSIQAIP